MISRQFYSSAGFRTPLLVAAIAAMVMACGDASSPDASTAGATVRDSAGIKIVENAIADDAPIVLSASEDPTVSIGKIEGEEASQLDRVADALRLPDGRIAILDGGSSEVRVFGADGAHQVSFGGDGEGPAEFAGYPRELGLVPPDTLLVWDFRTWETSWFLADGTFIRKEPGRTDYETHLPEGSRSASGYAVPGQGLLLQVSDFERPAPGEVFVPSRELTFIGRDGTMRVLGDFGGRRQVATERTPGLPASADLPFAGWGITAFDERSNRVWAGRNDRYELRQFTGTGELQRIVRTDRMRRPVTDEDVDRLIGQMREAMSEGGVPAEMIESQANAMRSAPAPDSMPAFGPTFVTTDGGAWVMPWIGPTSENGTLPTHMVYDVFAPDGRWRGVAEIPRVVIPTEIGDDYLLGTRRDELDVEHVELYELGPPPDAP